MPSPIDRAALKMNLRRARRLGADIGAADFVAREIDLRMQERLDYVRLAPQRILDLGCGDGGHSLAALRGRYPDACCVGVDAETSLLLHTKATGGLYLAADAERLPLPDDSFDLVWANLLLPWLANPLAMAREALRVLQPGGLLMLSALGPDTLRELRAGFADGYAHTQAFIDLHDLGDLLLDAGFADPVADMEMLTLTYTRLDALIAELRAAGVTCAMQNRRKSLAGRSLRQSLAAHYENLRAGREDGRLPVSVEIVYAHAWKSGDGGRVTGDRMKSVAPIRFMGRGRV
ncbi:malonyl-[acyl-carrier protein] O-methyltransferase [Betaproteobacteria bacterium]|nr:malonyl-[acyl-carrier protein] O-methyltransferase [Betaproteobacteria bacterium]GHU42205.1 malonyl-[acyl-carrier protein] O-methyltransferase [Betaproteobacteria bacterium]